MSPLALRRRLNQYRNSLAAATAVLALSSAVIAHHIEMPSGHDSMAMHGTSTMMACLGILGLAAMAVAATPRLGRVLAHPLRAASTQRSGGIRLPAAQPHLSRAGPPLYLSLSVLRR